MTLLMLHSCDRPAADATTLVAIKTEARWLMTTHAVGPERIRDIPYYKWPPVIAGLRPERITVYPWGIAIRTRAFFDGGWGYDIPRDESGLPMPSECYSEPVEGLFWHGPC